MADKMVEFFWEHPGRFVFRLFLSVTVLCALLTFMPEWFNAVFGILLLVVIIAMITRWRIKQKKNTCKQESTEINNYEKMYAEYGDLINRKIEELGVDKNHIRSDWFQSFYAYFQKATRLCNRGKFTDFHIVACIIFSLVSYADDIEHTEIIYKCVRELIAKPRVYIRHINDDDEITLEVEKTRPEVNLTLIEDAIAPGNFAQIIKEMYIKNKTGKALIELADFLNRVYLSCT